MNRCRPARVAIIAVALMVSVSCTLRDKRSRGEDLLKRTSTSIANARAFSFSTDEVSERTARDGSTRSIRRFGTLRHSASRRRSPHRRSTQVLYQPADDWGLGGRGAHRRQAVRPAGMASSECRLDDLDSDVRRTTAEKAVGELQDEQAKGDRVVQRVEPRAADLRGDVSKSSP